MMSHYQSNASHLNDAFETERTEFLQSLDEARNNAKPIPVNFILLTENEEVKQAYYDLMNPPNSQNFE